MPNPDVRLFDKDLLTYYKDAQKSIPTTYSPDDEAGQIVLAVEEQSADFLEDYIQGKAEIAEDAQSVLAEYLDILKTSTFSRIKGNLGKAESKFKKESILAHKKKTLSKKKEPKKQEVSSTYFKALNDKKKRAKLSSLELLDMKEKIRQITEFRTDKIEAMLNSCIQNKIDRTLKGEIEPDEGFDELVGKGGTYKQRSLVRRRQENKAKESEIKEPEVIVDPIIIEPSRPSPIFDNIYNETNEVKEIKENNDKPKKEPWYKRAWNKAKKTLLVAAVGVAGILGITKAASSCSNTTNDDAKKPTTEMTAAKPVQEQTAPVVDEQTTTIEQQTPVVTQETNTDNAPTTQKTEVSSLDSLNNEQYKLLTEPLLKVAKYDKKLAKKDKEQADAKFEQVKANFDNFIDGIKDKLPEGVSVERMEYLCAFYAGFPGSEFGGKINQILNGKTVDLSHQEITKTNQEHGDFGETAPVLTNATGKNSAIDGASKGVREKYHKHREEIAKAKALQGMGR